MRTDYKERYEALRREVYYLIDEEDRKEFGLNKIYGLKSYEEIDAWEKAVTENIINKFENDPNVHIDNLGQKFTNCPLCRRGSSSPYQIGFKLSEGLRRHLLGTHKPSYRCFFMKMAYDDAVDRLAKVKTRQS